jgi:hypothetical protein
MMMMLIFIIFDIFFHEESFFVRSDGLRQTPSLSPAMFLASRQFSWWYTYLFHAHDIYEKCEEFSCIYEILYRIFW